MPKRRGVALIGVGTVGKAVHDLIEANKDYIAANTDVHVSVASACARDVEKARGNLGPDVEVSGDWREAVANPNADIVVEVIGGLDPAYDIALAALAESKPLVTANKALLAHRGEEILAKAHANQGAVMFEAAVAGCIPVIRTLRDAYNGDRITKLQGIVNGTCNHILSNMRRTGIDFTTALAEATELGFAEADPTLDIEGLDAAHKIVIMSWLAFGTPLTMDGLAVSGVQDADPVDDRLANLFGYTTKLVASAIRHPAGIEMQVARSLVSLESRLAHIEDNFNAVTITSQAAGDMLMIGAGAGGMPTASAVLSDIVEAARGHPRLPAPASEHAMLPEHAVPREVFLRLRTTENQGVLAQVTSTLAAANISIEAMHQDDPGPGNNVDIGLLLHEVDWATLAAAVDKLAAMPELVEKPVVLPVAVPSPLRDKE